MRGSSVWRVLLGLSKTVIESVDIEDEANGNADDDPVLVAVVHPTRSARSPS